MEISKPTGLTSVELKTDAYSGTCENQLADAAPHSAITRADSKQPELVKTASASSNRDAEIDELIGQCDVDEAIKLLQCFDPDGWHNLVAIHPDKNAPNRVVGRTFPPGSWAEMKKFIETHNGRRNLYFSVNEPKPNARHNKLCKEEIAFIRAIHVDIDPNEQSADEFKAKRAHVESVVAELSSDPARAPSAVTDSGGGYQCFWKLSEKLDAGSPGDESNGDWAEKQAEAIGDSVGGDSTHDRNRIMRLPGTVNLPDDRKRKKGRKPAIARLLSANERTYSQEDLAAIAEPTTGSKGSKSSRSNKVKRKKEEDAEIEAVKKQLDMTAIESVAEVNDLTAELQERFEAARRRNPKLAALWEGDEGALGPDKSGSAYRFALARHLRADGFTAQEYGLLLQTRDYAFEGDTKAQRRQIARDWVKGCPKAGQPDNLVRPPGEPMPNARAFLASKYGHADRLLLIQQGGQFYHWDGTCWPAIDDPMLRGELYKWFEEKSYFDGKDVKPFAPTTRKIADLMDATKAITLVPTTLEAPSWLHSSRYPAEEVISCQNGLVHWPTRTRFDHHPCFYIHHSVPFAFDPDAALPEKWLTFLDDIWGNDEETISALQEMFGYLVSGDTRQQKMFLLAGPKRGGKGTIARVLTRMLGRHNVAGPTLASLGTNFGLQDLIGKPVAIISDARMGNKSDSSLIAERLLSISGEDLQNVDRKYLLPWSGYLPTRFVMLTNELPRFTDASGALASRFIVLMLRKSFYDKENPDLSEELCQELPGIFNWALDGLQKLRGRRRFLQPSASKDAIQELEDLASPIGAFLRECCILRADGKVEVATIYRAYRRWCEDYGRGAVNRQVFGRDLRAIKPEIKISRVGGHESIDRARIYTGLTLRNMPDAADSEEAFESCVRSVRSGGGILALTSHPLPPPLWEGQPEGPNVAGAMQRRPRTLRTQLQ